MESYLLTVLIFLPLIGAAALWGHSFFWLKRFPLEKIREHYRWIALGFAVVNFLLSLLILPRFNAAASGYQLEINKPWIESLGANYHLGIDGISLWLVLLTTFLVPICMCGNIGKRKKLIH